MVVIEPVLAFIGDQARTFVLATVAAVTTVDLVLIYSCVDGLVGLVVFGGSVAVRELG